MSANEFSLVDAPPPRPRWTDLVLLGLVLTGDVRLLLGMHGILEPIRQVPIEALISGLVTGSLLIIVIKTLGKFDVSFGLSFPRWLALFAFTGLAMGQAVRIALLLPALVEPMGLRKAIYFALGFGFHGLIMLAATYATLAILFCWPVGPRRHPRPPVL